MRNIIRVSRRFTIKRRIIQYKEFKQILSIVSIRVKTCQSEWRFFLSRRMSVGWTIWKVPSLRDEMIGAGTGSHRDMLKSSLWSVKFARNKTLFWWMYILRHYVEENGLLQQLASPLDVFKYVCGWCRANIPEDPAFSTGDRMIFKFK